MNLSIFVYVFFIDSFISCGTGIESHAIAWARNIAGKRQANLHGFMLAVTWTIAGWDCEHHHP